MLKIIYYLLTLKIITFFPVAYAMECKLVDISPCMSCSAPINVDCNQIKGNMRDTELVRTVTVEEIDVLGTKTTRVLTVPDSEKLKPSEIKDWLEKKYELSKSTKPTSESINSPQFALRAESVEIFQDYDGKTPVAPKKVQEGYSCVQFGGSYRKLSTDTACGKVNLCMIPVHCDKYQDGQVVGNRREPAFCKVNPNGSCPHPTLCAIDPDVDVSGPPTSSLRAQPTSQPTTESKGKVVK